MVRTKQDPLLKFNESYSGYTRYKRMEISTAINLYLECMKYKKRIKFSKGKFEFYTPTQEPQPQKTQEPQPQKVTRNFKRKVTLKVTQKVTEDKPTSDTSDNKHNTADRLPSIHSGLPHVSSLENIETKFESDASTKIDKGSVWYAISHKFQSLSLSSSSSRGSGLGQSLNPNDETSEVTCDDENQAAPEKEGGNFARYFCSTEPNPNTPEPNPNPSEPQPLAVVWETPLNKEEETGIFGAVSDNMEGRTEIFGAGTEVSGDDKKRAEKEALKAAALVPPGNAVIISAEKGGPSTSTSSRADFTAGHMVEVMAFASLFIAILQQGELKLSAKDTEQMMTKMIMMINQGEHKVPAEVNEQSDVNDD